MKTFYLLMLMTASGVAQQFPALPSPYNPYVRGASDAAAAAAGNYRTGSEAKAKAEELKIQQGWLDLARQQAAQSKGSASLVAPGADIQQALLIANMAHPDFNTLAPGMQIIARALRPDWSKMTTDEYLECLYVIAKNASFAAQFREKLPNAAAPVPPTGNTPAVPASAPPQ